MASINKEIASPVTVDVFALIPAHARKKSHEREEGVSLAPLYLRVKSREGEREREKELSSATSPMRPTIDYSLSHRYRW